MGAAGPTLRVCTWNINLGLRLDQVLEAVARDQDFAGLDLLALQEASEHDGRSDGLAVAAALGPDYECHQVAAQTVKGHLQANAMIWNKRRIEVRRVDHLHLPGSADLRSGPGSALFMQQRNSVVVEGTAEGVPVLAYSVHLDIFGTAHKQRQLAHVLEDRHARPVADLTVVAGDLNLFHLSRWPSWSKLIRAYEAEGFVDAARSIRWTHSFRNLPIKQKLDSILVRSSAECELVSWTLPAQGSDHLPLFANLNRR